MASVRRTKNFANDPQTPMFLYTILKQLDLRSINWSEVADGLGISNGHAARMRYSRMKSQFEGLSTQPTPPKPKRENPGQSKSAKSKAKDNKRRLIEEETERLGRRPSNVQFAMPQEHDPKRIKVEPQSYTDPWTAPGIYTGYSGQPGANTYWCQPSGSSEPSHPAMPTTPRQSVTATPGIKHEPETTASSAHGLASSGPAIKQEPGLPGKDSDMTDRDVVVVGREPGTSLAERSPTPTHQVPVAPGHPASRTVHAYFGRRHAPLITTQPRPSVDSMAGYATPQTFPYGSYPYLGHCNPTQRALSWTAPVLGQNSRATSLEDDTHNVMLSPYATTYQDMLNMPLYRRRPSVLPISSPSTQQIANGPSSNEAQRVGRGQDVNSAPPAAAASAPDDRIFLVATTGRGPVTSNTPPEVAAIQSDPAESETGVEQASPATDAILVKTGAEVVGNVFSAPLVIDDGVVEIKAEVVEL
ncbi:hypothetical protein PV04_09818 [Phialophora macrospora]|uniref:Myb-like DNA-binding domain-containing protein n=1 Tax=Phialophora macrospora TaxID=1851006 RepID=A0A0D2F7H4_9EURO|nr:hypothetical protein PV04_09818 [Phialophora macrospora]